MFNLAVFIKQNYSFIQNHHQLKKALLYLAYFGLVYLVFIVIYSVFFFNFVAKQQTQFIQHIFWWLKLSGVWFVFAPLAIIALSKLTNMPLLARILLLGVPMVIIAVVLQLAFDYRYFKADLVGQFVLFLPRQIGIFIAVCCFWLLCVNSVWAQNVVRQQDADKETTIKRAVINVEHLGRPYAIQAEHILALNSAGNYVEIETTEGTFLKRISLKDILALLPNYFYQCHRSYAVNLHQVSSMQNQTSGTAVIYLSSGSKIPVSKSAKARLKQRLAQQLINGSVSDVETD